MSNELSSHWYIIGLIIALFAFKVLANGEPVIAYKAKHFAFTKTELKFYHALNAAVGNDYVIMGKMRIADILQPKTKRDNKNWWKAFTKISSKHIDFVLLNKRNLSFVAAIELDDSSHARSDRIQRDLFVNKAFKSANFNLLRIKTARYYDATLIRKVIQNSIGEEKQ